MTPLEQGANIKFCVLIKKSPSETLELLKKAYRNDAMKKKWLCTSGIIGKRERGKVMVEIFFNYDSVIQYEFIPEGQTVNKEFYLEILKRLRDVVRRKRPEKWATNDWFLLHYNAPPDRALMVKKYLARHSVITLEHPPYSHDLAPSDFYVFPRLKMKLEGHRFVDLDEVIENAMKQLKDLSKNGFQDCFEQLYER
ncbi:hypothetical protein AVEN_215441-1 [Araneus ventricosus]|uniref:Mariner Mos1 transposase n=1 Tax=Araneus ventricosus TaxID=182803 RepID=A0A4Y2KP76_ARAVE|nr:hypothetical protein AVEN_215441-1 [Araneus ventricosus]